MKIYFPSRLAALLIISHALFLNATPAQAHKKDTIQECDKLLTGFPTALQLFKSREGGEFRELGVGIMAHVFVWSRPAHEAIVVKSYDTLGDAREDEEALTILRSLAQPEDLVHVIADRGRPKDTLHFYQYIQGRTVADTLRGTILSPTEKRQVLGQVSQYLDDLISRMKNRLGSRNVTLVRSTVLLGSSEDAPFDFPRYEIAAKLPSGNRFTYIPHQHNFLVEDVTHAVFLIDPR